VVSPELRVAVRPEEVGEAADAGGVGGLIDAEALPVHAGELADVAPELPLGGHRLLLGLEREREDLRQGAGEQRPAEVRAERAVRDDDEAVRHHGRGHRVAGGRPPRPAGLHAADVHRGDLHGSRLPPDHGRLCVGFLLDLASR
jgi:hypothetical protein